MHAQLASVAFDHVRATIPLPLADNDGLRFTRADVRWFERRLLALGSGFRRYPRVRGRWREDGRMYRERVAVYVSTIDGDRLPELQDLLEEACARFRQEAILLELTPVEKMLLTRARQDRTPMTVSPAEASG